MSRCVPRRDLARRDRDRPQRAGAGRDRADLRATGVEDLALYGGAENDELSARGGRGSGIELQAGVALAGDGGDDLLIGGAGPAR